MRRFASAAPTVMWLSGAAFCASGIALVAHLVFGWSLVTSAVALLFVAVPTVVLAFTHPDRRVSHRIQRGIVVGAIATVAYDVARLVGVKVTGSSINPFGAWPLFGRALVGDESSPWIRQGAGVAFHVINGVGFGIAYALWFGGLKPLWGIAWAMVLEAAMLALYPGWLDIRAIREFTQITMVGHITYGLVLGFGCRKLPRFSSIDRAVSE
jgi:hypothetical protein